MCEIGGKPMRYFNKFFSFLFIIFVTTYGFSADQTSDITKTNKKELSDFEKKLLYEKQESEKRIKFEKEAEKIKQQKIAKVKEDMKKNLNNINNAKKQIYQLDKQITVLNNSLITTLNKEQIEKIQNKKSELLLKRTNFNQSIIDGDFLYRKQQKELAFLNEKFVIADGTLNWSKSYDISDTNKYKNGKWSITVKAVDTNGNESQESAINIKIDPNSDIPYLNIINPTKDARVPGNLKIVGTAYDDDAIDKIVLYVDAEKEKRICDGKDFWYYNLDTSNMKDGIHTLKLKVYDIKGVTSKDYFVSFQLDRKTPSVVIKTMKSGAIVSGVMNVGGDGFDDNGIIKMEYSIDERINFSEVPNIKYLDNNKTKLNWSVRIDSEKLVEGIQTIWIRATDATGSVGYSPLTVTVDHKKPTISIDFPKDKDTVDGTFTAYGFVKDNVEVKNISYAIDGAGSDGKFKEIKLLPGNPYWSFPVNMSKLKNGKFKLIAKVEDVAGNITTSFINIILNSEKDKPILTLKSLKKDDRVSSSLELFGDLTDDDGKKEVLIKIFKDGSTSPIYTETLPVRFNFSKEVDLSDNTKFPDGKYTVELTPVDINDVAGIPVKESFFIDKSNPKFDEKTIDNFAGKLFTAKIDLPIKVLDAAGIKTIKYSIFDPISKKDIVAKKEIKFKESKTFGLIETSISEDLSKSNFSDKIVVIKLEATDFVNNTTNLSIPVIIDSISPNVKDLVFDSKVGLTKDVTIDIYDNLTIKDLQIEFGSSIKKEPEKIKVSDSKLADGYKKEFTLKVKDADGKTYIEYTLNITVQDLAGNITKKSFKINFKETKLSSHKIRINLTQKKELNPNQETIVLLDKENFDIDNIGSTFYCLFPPNIKDGKIKYEKTSEVTELVDDPKNKKKKIEVTKTVVEFVELLSSSIINTDFGISVFKFTKDQRQNINIGKNTAKLSTIDTEGLESDFFSFTYYNDLSMPEASIIWPPSYYYFNDSIFIYGVAYDDSKEFDVSYSIDSNNNFNSISVEDFSSAKNEFVPDLTPLKRTEKVNLLDYLTKNNINIPPDRKLFKVELPLTQLKNGEHSILFNIKDKSGKILEKKFNVIYDNKYPDIKISTPKENQVVNGQITIRGDAADDAILSDIVIMHNGKEMIANGTKFWEGLYNLNELEGIEKTEEQILHKIEIFAIDAAGNKKNIEQNIKIDTTSDAPIIYVNSPAVPDQRFTDIVELGGVALDDDGVEYVQYRIDNTINQSNGEIIPIGKWERIDMVKGNPNWNKKIPKESLTAGRHTLEVQPIDIYGLKGKVVSITFHLDLENPEIRILGPENGTYLEGEKIISGKASDPNEIDKVEISTNYGWTFVKTEGQENWKYYFDSRSVPDGSLRVLIRAKDKAGSEAFSFALYNIDNKFPEVDILLPKEASKINNKYRIVGRAKDNIGIKSVKINIDSDDWAKVNEVDEEGFVEVLSDSGDSKEAWYYDINTRGWDPTRTYHLIVRVKDLSGNMQEKSLNFQVDPISDLPTVELDQPQPGQHVTGDTIDFFGTAYDDDGIEAVYIKVDDMDQVKVDGTKVWRYSLPTVNMEAGIHKVVIVAQEISQDGKPGKFSGPITRLFYFDDSGPVVKITSHINGEPMEHRPWLSGTSYYFEKDLELKLKKQIQLKKYYDLKMRYRRTPEKIPEVDSIPVKQYEVDFLKQKYLWNNSIKDIFLSIDNGKTYQKYIGTTANWQTRVQTQYLRDGSHMFQLKAVTNSGKESIKYFRVLIDRDMPIVTIDEPVENKSVNESIFVRGSTMDKGKVETVKILLRQFDKNLGKVPKFIQGFYLWTQFLGGPWVSGGFGLSFFEDVVRLEGLFGWTPTRSNMFDMNLNPNDIPEIFRQDFTNKRYQPRFSGFTVGGKLLARIVDVPYEFFFGEDAKNFSSSIEIGAGFYWFSGYGGSPYETSGQYYEIERKRSYAPLKDGKILAGFMYQIDLFKIERFGIFRKFAIYFENAFFFIASEIEGGLFPQLGFGIRNAFF